MHGNVHVYKIKSHNPYTWSKSSLILGTHGDRLGKSVAVSSDGYRLVVGASSKSDPLKSGNVSIYTYVDSSWQVYERVIQGVSFDISADGKTLVTGNPSYINGHVRIFNFNNGFWKQNLDPIYGNEDYDNTGKYVAISSDGTILAVGAPNHGHNRGLVSVRYCEHFSNPPSEPINYTE